MSRMIEVCSNNEWVVNHLLSELGLENTNKNEAANEWFDDTCRQIDDLFGDDITAASNGQRAMYHGWNGANMFTRKESGIGTFSEFTDEEWDQCTSIALTVAGKVVDRYCVLD